MFVPVVFSFLHGHRKTAPLPVPFGEPHAA
jgi:hypothetical protein